jgi:putative polyhydroxyalkanoate system protein
MADISIVQNHTLSMEQARVAAQKVADQMVADYEMVAEWNGDVLSFKRTGVSGTLSLAENQAHLEIALGFMLKAFASKIEEKVTKNMQKVFSATA